MGAAITEAAHVDTHGHQMLRRTHFLTAGHIDNLDLDALLFSSRHYDSPPKFELVIQEFEDVTSLGLLKCSAPQDTVI
jgi:hypothetical protein